MEAKKPGDVNLSVNTQLLLIRENQAPLSRQNCRRIEVLTCSWSRTQKGVFWTRRLSFQVDMATDFDRGSDKIITAYLNILHHPFIRDSSGNLALEETES